LNRKRARILILVTVLWGCVAVGGVSAETGVVDGVEYDDKFAFEKPLEGEEVDAVISRAMARVEHIRQREFKDRPRVESLEQGDVPGAGSDVNRTQEGDWNDVVWKAMLIIGDDRYANQAIADTFGSATAGFYETDGQMGAGNETNESGRGRIGLVGEIHEPTLAHELIHVMQDQYYNLSAERLNPPVQDEQLAGDGVVEGEAEYVRYLYEDRCETDWQCYTSEGGGTGTEAPDESVRDTHLGILFVAFQPYSDGSQYVHELVQDGGWEAVDEAFEKPPNTSREIIHREPHERPEFGFEDTAEEGWSLFDSGRDGYDIAGEASVFVTFWYQSHPLGYGLNVVESTGFSRSDDEYSRYDYVSDVSEGLAADRIYPYYRETEEGENETGFLWLTTWDTPEDAELFADKYAEVLEGHGGENLGNSTWFVEGEFSGAYHIAHRGREVTVVHGPTVESLGEVRPSIGGEGSVHADVIDARPIEPGSVGSIFENIFPSISLPNFSSGSALIPMAVGVLMLLIGSFLVVFRLRI